MNLNINMTVLMNYSAPLKSRLDEETISLLIRSFASYIKSLYLDMIEEEMYSPRYKGSWEPDDKNYIEYLGTDPKKPIIYYMRDSIEVAKIGYNLVVRFDPTYRYPKSSLSLVKVLRALEYGNSDIAARPIIEKCSKKITQNILKLWRGYLSLKGVV